MTTHLPNYLRAHRKSAGLSQRDVARLLGGKNGSKVSGYEHFTRTPTLRTALKLQAILDRPVAELFEGMFKETEHAVTSEAQTMLARHRPHPTDATAPRQRRLSQIAESLTHHENVPF